MSIIKKYDDNRHNKELSSAIRHKSTQSLIPFKGKLYITFRCNFNCRHCFCKGIETDEMNCDQWCSVLDQLAEMGTLHLGISGGEPLLRPDFLEIMEYARKKGFHVAIETNGYFMTEEIAVKLRKLYICDVYISIYSISEGNYKKITGVSDSYEKVFNGIRILKKHGLNVTPRYLACKDNYDECFSIRDVINEEFGLEKTQVNTVLVPRMDDSLKNLECMLTEEQIEKLLKTLGAFNWPKEFCHDNMRESGGLCKAGLRQFVILPNGHVQACSNPVKLSSRYSLKEKSFRDIWENDELLNEFRNYKIENLQKCFNCEALAFCSVCPMEMLLANGVLEPYLKRCEDSFLNKKLYESATLKDAKK